MFTNTFACHDKKSVTDPLKPISNNWLLPGTLNELTTCSQYMLSFDFHTFECIVIYSKQNILNLILSIMTHYQPNSHYGKSSP